MRRGGFSLVEISIVLVVVSVMISGVLPYITESQKTNAANDTAERLEAIELAMLTFRAANGFIPCPSDIDAALNGGTFGTAVASGCATANFTDANNAAGGVPTRDLGLSDEYAFDGWGRRMTYHVTRTLTGAGYGAGTGALTVNDASGAARTTAAAYAVVSHGPNGHGAYTRAGTRFSFGATDPREQENCECDASATATTYDSILVQSMAIPNSNPLAAFDDIVRYQLKPSLELLVGGGGGGGSCTGVAPSGWPDAIKCVNGTTTIPLIYNADTGGGTVIYRRDHPTTDIQLQFNQATQAYQSNANLTGYDCISKSIPTLETEGKTFSFCGGSGGGATKGFTAQGTSTAVPSSVWTEVVFSSVAKNDFSAGDWTGNKIFTVPAGEAGWYALTASAAHPASTESNLIISFYVNGAAYYASRDYAAAAVTHYVTSAAMRYLDEGDTVSLRVWSAPSGVTLSGANLGIVKLGGGGGGGNTPADYEVVTAAILVGDPVGWYSATCPAGKYVLGGSCTTGSGNVATNTRVTLPGPGNSFDCYKHNIVTNWTIRATCASSLGSSGGGGVSATDFQTVSNSVTAIGNKTVSVTCPANYTMTGGGCNAVAWGSELVDNYPNGNGWYCASKDSYGTAQTTIVYARCVLTN
ncbi:MAG: hypothetical protein C0519_04650 [Hyphomicrobium sp.]|nr:hypothetical protein [Hyphomicrobium sp.]